MFEYFIKCFKIKITQNYHILLIKLSNSYGGIPEAILPFRNQHNGNDINTVKQKHFPEYLTC